MKGTEWMENLLGCEAARRNIPLGFQATPPLPGRRGAHTAECWYYRLECQSDGATSCGTARRWRSCGWHPWRPFAWVPGRTC